MKAQTFWRDGALFGLVTGSLTAFYGSYLIWAPWPSSMFFLATTLPLFVLVWTIGSLWLATRGHLAAYLKQQDEEDKEAGKELPMDETVSLTDPYVDPFADPFAEYMRCHRQLWRLEARGLDDKPQADGLRRRMGVYWAQMDEDQRYKVDVEAGDAWKYLCDEDDQVS